MGWLGNGWFPREQEKVCGVQEEEEEVVVEEGEENNKEEEESCQKTSALDLLSSSVSSVKSSSFEQMLSTLTSISVTKINKMSITV